MAQHALLSASGADKWYSCPPSARLEEGLPDSESQYAAEGTLAHSLAELINSYNLHIIDKKVFNKRFKEFKTDSLYTEDMYDHAVEFSKYVHEELMSARKRTRDAFIGLEERLDFSDYVPEGFGTGDVVIIDDATLHIIDFKYGKGVMVSADDNKQMKLYALGAYSSLSMLYDFDRIVMTVYQPRLDNISSFELTTTELLAWAEGELKERAALAFDGGGEFSPGEHCRFCKIKAQCRARAEQNLKLQDYEYTNPALLSDDEISDILIISERLSSWANDVAAFALDEALKGKKWRGFKLVEGRSNRKYADEDAVAGKLKDSGYTEDQVYRLKLLGITDMETLLGKKRFTELLDGLIAKPPGAPTLAVESDKRPEYNTAVTDFENVQID